MQVCTPTAPPPSRLTHTASGLLSMTPLVDVLASQPQTQTQHEEVLVSHYNDTTVAPTALSHNHSRHTLYWM